MTTEFNKSQFASAYKTAPRAVREAMGSQTTTNTISQLQKTYALHVDTVGNISKATGYMLLGLLGPDAFYKFLLEQNISAENATTIIQEVNTQIFLPLQKVIRDGGAAAEPVVEVDEPEAEYDPSLDTPSNVAPATVPQWEQAAPQVPVMQIAPTVVPPPLTAPVPQPIPQAPQADPVQTETPSYNLIRPDVLVPAPRPVMLHSMQADIEALQQPGVSQTTGPVSTPTTLHASHTTPARSFQTASVPFATPVFQQPIPVPSTTLPQPTVPTQLPQLTAPVFDTRNDSPMERLGDPYREPM